jgi:hypothetical protein
VNAGEREQLVEVAELIDVADLGHERACDPTLSPNRPR